MPVREAGATQIRAATARAMNDLMFEANQRLQLESLTAQDVRIDVEMGDIGSMDFERTPETIALGEAAARRAAPQLARLAVSPEEYLAWRSKVTSEQGIKTRVGEVHFAQLPRVNPAVPRPHCRHQAR